MLELIGGALTLDANAFVALLGGHTRVGPAIVYLAGVSIALGQSVALFAARIPPRRFAFALMIQAASFLGGFLLWATSTHLVATALLGARRPLADAIDVVGLAHAPQLFGVLVLAPYLGGPLWTVLSIWTLLATVIATSAAYALSVPQAIACGGGGWLLTVLVRSTLGRPLTRLGRRLTLRR